MKKKSLKNIARRIGACVFALGVAVATLAVGGTTAKAAATRYTIFQNGKVLPGIDDGSNGDQVAWLEVSSGSDSIAYDKTSNTITFTNAVIEVLEMESSSNVKICGSCTIENWNINMTTKLTMDSGAKLTCTKVAVSPTEAGKNALVLDGVTKDKDWVSGKNNWNVSSYVLLNVAFTPGSATDAGDGESTENATAANNGGSEYDRRLSNKVDVISDAEDGSKIVITKEDGINTLPNSIMHALVVKETVSLEMSYEYEGKEYTILIPAGGAIDSDIGWYGPLYLAAHFGTGVNAATGANNVYTIQPGDSLSKIAVKFGTTVANLMEKNPQIKDKNKIIVGKTLNY